MERSVADMKKSPAFCVYGGTNTVTGDFGGELIMPDYYPEIRKIVTVRASAIPDSKYIHDNELETGGTLSFDVLYIGDDQTLSCVPYVSEYSQVTTVPDGVISADCINVESVAEGISARPLGPRKISLKARVKNRISCDKYEPYLPMIAGPESSPLDTARRRSMEKLERQAECIEKKLYQLTGSAKDELKTDGIMKPVMCYGDILINETRADSRIVNVKGEIALSIIVQNSDGAYGTYCHSIPFEERVDGETVTKNTKAVAAGRLAQISVTLGDDGATLYFDAEYDLDVYTANAGQITFTEDIYSREYEFKSSHREIKSQSLLCCSNTSLSLAAEGRRKGQKAQEDYLVSCIADAKIEKVTTSKGKATAFGLCSFSAYIASGGEIITEEFSTPFSAEIPISEEKAPSELIFHAKAGASGCNCTIQEQKIHAECRISVSLAAFELESLFPIWEACIGDKNTVQCNDCVIKVCFPEKGKRIWDIAKEHKASTLLCEKINKKSRTDICDASPVIIK